MQKYTKTYLKAFGYSITDNSEYVPCECCQGKATEIHHILNKNRMIGWKQLDKKDCIENLMAICRDCHQKFGEINYLIPHLLRIHKGNLDINKIPYNNQWFEEKIEYYEKSS